MTDIDDRRLVVISLGAGVQSTTMLLMACHGEIDPMPDAAVFADTGWEPKAVYDHLNWLESVSSIPIIRAQYGDIYQHAKDDPARVDMPLHLIGERGPGILRRQCTGKYKITPIRRAIRQLMNERGIDLAPGVVISWLGISLDEVQRMRDSDVQYITNRYPLIEKRLTRHDCLLWLERNGYPRAPKSSCIGCPYHSNQMWRDMAKESPEEFEQACQFDEAMRHARPGYTAFLHRNRIPLRQIDLHEEDSGQLSFLDECDGICEV